MQAQGNPSTIHPGNAPDLHERISAWNQTRTDYPRDYSVDQLVWEQAYRRPSAVAIEYQSRQITYSDLVSRAADLAAAMIDAGVGPEAAVAIAMPRCPELVIAMLAVLMAGGTYVPIDIRDPVARIGELFSDCGVTVCLVTEDSGQRLAQLGVTFLVCGPTPNRGIDKTAAKLTRRNLPTSRAYIMYTSGSTGVPKGVEVVHRGIVRLVRDTNYIQFRSDDVVGQIANPAFDAITFEVWGALLNGARLAILPPETVLSPSRLAAAISGQGISVMFLTSALFSVVAAAEPCAFGTMRTLVVGGAAVDPTAARRVLHTAPPERLVNGYGPTECTTFSVCHLIESVDEAATSIPIGRPISNSEAYILDDALQPVEIGQVGELYLGGDGLARGHLNRPDLTRERFVPHPFNAEVGSRLYRTGDRARYLADGLIEFLGRDDDQVKFRGFRVELGEIETILQRHPGIATAAVVVRRQATGDERLCAYVSLVPGMVLSESEIQEYVRGVLPEYMVPAQVGILDRLPLTPVGKIDKTSLMATNHAAPPKKLGAPSTRLEDQIAATWREVLSLTHVGAEDNFFDVGGSSLTLSMLECRLRASVAPNVTITDLFHYPTVRSLAGFLTGEMPQHEGLATVRERARKQRAVFDKALARS